MFLYKIPSVLGLESYSGGSSTSAASRRNSAVIDMYKLMEILLVVIIHHPCCSFPFVQNQDHHHGFWIGWAGPYRAIKKKCRDAQPKKTEKAFFPFALEEIWPRNRRSNGQVLSGEVGQTVQEGPLSAYGVRSTSRMLEPKVQGGRAGGGSGGSVEPITGDKPRHRPLPNFRCVKK